MNQDPLLLQLLANAKLSDKEAKVYLALLEIGEASVQKIAEHSGLKRPIIYVILEDLINRGYASEIPDKKIRTFRAADPDAISAQLRTAAQNFADMLPVFKTLANRGGAKPKIAYFDTPEAMNRVYDEINQQKSAIFIASFSPFNRHFPDAVNQWQKNYKKKHSKLRSRTLIPNNPDDIAIAKKFMAITDMVEIRVMASMKDCPLDLTVYGNKLVITTFDEKPFMVVIESEAIPQFFNPIFEMLWQSAKKVK